MAERPWWLKLRCGRDGHSTINAVGGSRHYTKIFTPPHPLAVRGHQGNRKRRIGHARALAADDTVSKDRLTAFAQGLQQLGWTVGQNVRGDYCWTRAALLRDHSFPRSSASLVACLRPRRHGQI